MTEAELDQLVARIGDQILARVQPGSPPPSSTPSRALSPLPASAQALAILIDHTLLRPDATEDEIRNLCAEARQHEFFSVCVNGAWTRLASAELRGSPVKTCTVVGFPLGAMTTASKCFEAEQAISDGSTEIDMVIPVGALAGGYLEAVEDDIRQVTQTCHRGGAIVKVIIETALLTDSQKSAACTIARKLGADFVKTSTGFAKSGATAHDVALMRATVGPHMGVKASGGVRTLDDLLRMTAAGASRIGASSSVRILEEAALAAASR